MSLSIPNICKLFQFYLSTFLFSTRLFAFLCSIGLSVIRIVISDNKPETPDNEETRIFSPSSSKLFTTHKLRILIKTNRNEF